MSAIHFHVIYVLTLCQDLHSYFFSYLHDRIISLREKVWAHKTSLTKPFLIEVPVPGQESERSCICMLVVLILPLSMILLMDFRIVLTV